MKILFVAVIGLEVFTILLIHSFCGRAVSGRTTATNTSQVNAVVLDVCRATRLQAQCFNVLKLP